MYSGTTFTNKSGSIMGAHQKIDRVARNNISKLLTDDSLFPDSKNILHFEGRNGPDGIKGKSPAVNEPWHFYNPFDDEDTQLINIIQSHYDQLVKVLAAHNRERVAFEAAWLAHAIVDGLTPAHHYPYEEKLIELRGEGIETRTTIKDKMVIPGSTKKEMVKNNWKMWGPKGLMSTHALFELGIAAIIAPLTLSSSMPTEEDIKRMQHVGVTEYFKQTAREIAVQDMYKRFYNRGWTTKLTLDIRKKLVPTITKAVTLAWYCAILDSKIENKK